MTNRSNNVLYTGVTNNLARRVYEHKTGVMKGFTSKYRITKLVYYEVFGRSINAITREKQIKAGSRRKKIELITKQNPEYIDLSNEVKL